MCRPEAVYNELKQQIKQTDLKVQALLPVYWLNCIYVKKEAFLYIFLDSALH